MQSSPCGFLPDAPRPIRYAPAPPRAPAPTVDAAVQARCSVALDRLLDPFGIYAAVRDDRGAIVDFRVEYVNDAACRANGLPRDAQVGRLLCDLFPGLRGSGLFRAYCELVRTGAPLSRDSHSHTDDWNGRRETRVFDIRASRLGDGFVAVWRDVTRERGVERDREQAHAALQLAQRHKDEFLAQLSHELRNFLAPVRNAASILAAAPPADDRAGRAAVVLQRQVDNLSRLVADMLDTSRIQAGKFEVDLRPLVVQDAVALAVDAAQPTAQARRQRLSVLDGGEPLWVRGDPLRLCQALTNLVLNAAKYTPEGGAIELRVAADDAQVRIAVADTGAGFEPSMATRLFDLYQQGRSGAHGGLGIGLHLVRTIMERHGGGVAAHSEGPGRGSTFTVWLPRQPAAGPAA